MTIERNIYLPGVIPCLLSGSGSGISDVCIWTEKSGDSLVSPWRPGSGSDHCPLTLSLGAGCDSVCPLTLSDTRTAARATVAILVCECGAGGAAAVTTDQCAQVSGEQRYIVSREIML